MTAAGSSPFRASASRANRDASGPSERNLINNVAAPARPGAACRKIRASGGSDRPPLMSTLLGTSLNGRYRLEARIAAGGMSTVYRAVDETPQLPETAE